MKRYERSVSAGTRFQVLSRDDFRCQYCGAQASDRPLHVDHVIPLALGGSNHHGNLITACAECNLGKHATAAPSKPTTVVETAILAALSGLDSRVRPVGNELSDLALVADDHGIDFVLRLVRLALETGHPEHAIKSAIRWMLHCANRAADRVEAELARRREEMRGKPTEMQDGFAVVMHAVAKALRP